MGFGDCKSGGRQHCLLGRCVAISSSLHAAAAVLPIILDVVPVLTVMKWQVCELALVLCIAGWYVYDSEEESENLELEARIDRPPGLGAKRTAHRRELRKRRLARLGGSVSSEVKKLNDSLAAVEAAREALAWRDSGESQTGFQVWLQCDSSVPVPACAGLAAGGGRRMKLQAAGDESVDDCVKSLRQELQAKELFLVQAKAIAANCEEEATAAAGRTAEWKRHADELEADAQEHKQRLAQVKAESSERENAMARQVSDLEGSVVELKELIEARDLENKRLRDRLNESSMSSVISRGGAPHDLAAYVGASSFGDRAASCNAMQEGQAAQASTAADFCDEHEIEHTVDGVGVCDECGKDFVGMARHWKCRHCPLGLCDDCGTKLIDAQEENEDKVAAIAAKTKELDVLSQSVWVKVLDQNSHLDNGELVNHFFAARENIMPFKTLGERRAAHKIIAEIIEKLDNL